MEPKLNNLPAPTRLCFSLFLIVVLLGLFTAAGQHVVVTGFDTQRTSAHYRGGEVGDAMYVEKPLQDMLRIAHTHLLGIGLLLFALCRILAMAPITDGVKIGGFSAAFGSLIFQSLAPWLVRFGSGSLSPLVGVSVALLSLTILTICLSSIYFMWYASPKKSSPQAKGDSSRT